MKRRVAVAFAVLLILLVSFSVFAQEDEKVEKAYSCLEDRVKDKCDDLSVEEQAFTVLATGKCSSELKDKGKDNECWPDSGCRLRDTSLAILALDRVGKDTGDAEDYLFNQKKIPDDLIWYLEIDADEETVCDISYGSTEKSVTIREDKRISGNAGTCLSLAQDNYWLKIDDDCYEVNFTISCDQDFKTTLLYSKKNSPTIYVSSRTNFASAEGTTKERVNAFCFEQGNSCDYEGSLWAALALAKTNNDVSEFLPYLIAMADENEKYLPSAFLYMITDYDEYFTQIIDQQNDYWKIPNSPYTNFYDTALALLALYGLDATQVDTAKDYLLEVQGEDGCWNTVRDTGFILYAAWPKSIPIVNGGGGMDDCEAYNYFCTSPLDCPQAELLDNYVCYGGKVCCRTEPSERTCYEKGGIECEEGQECSGSWIPASDTNRCCLGASCQDKPEETECEKANYNCRYSCLDDEEEKVYDCDSGEVCCGPKVKETGSYWWIWILVVLIVLVVLGIVFKAKLRAWLFKMKNRFKKGPSPAAKPGGFPPAPPGMATPRTRTRMMLPRRPAPGRQPSRRPATKTDKELEDTLKKLKEMGK